MKLLVTSSPHIHSGTHTSRLMGAVLAALLPALLAGVWFFGLRSLALVGVTVLSCLLSEWGYRKLTRQSNTLPDLSAAVTGVLLAMTLPATVPYWLAAVGGVFAIVVVKGLIGGLGQNIFNPALAARALLVLLWPSWMVRYAPAGTKPDPLALSVDMVASATPLHHMQMPALPTESLLDVFFGQHGRLHRGSFGPGAAAGRRLPAGAQGDLLAHPGCLPGHRGPAYPDLLQRAEPCSLDAVQPDERRRAAGRLLYGYRLRHLSRNAPGPAALRAGLRCTDRGIPLLRAFPGRRHLRHPADECLCLEPGPAYAAQAFWHRERRRRTMKQKQWLAPVAALLLAAVVLFLSRTVLSPIARENKEQELQSILSTLLPGAGSFTEEEYTGEDESISAVYKAENGYVVETVTAGYAGDITMLVGVYSDGSIASLVVRDMQETYGLGMGALSDVDFLSQFLWNGTSFTVGENVDALAGATVTSKAVAKAVTAASAFVTGADVSSGATEWGG